MTPIDAAPAMKIRPPSTPVLGPGSRVLARLAAFSYERRFRRNRDENLFRGVYDSAQAATRSAPVAAPIGYDNDQSAGLYDYHLVRVFAHDYAAMFWMERSFAEGSSSVLDIGGHVGLKYYAFRKYLSYPKHLRWQVCDVPSVIARGK